MNTLKKGVAAAALLVTSLTATSALAADNVVLRWTDVMLQAIRDTHPLPPITARHLAILDTCMYDAWTAYDRKAIPTRANGVPRQGISNIVDIEKAVSYAAYRAVLDLTPSAAAPAAALMTSLGYNPADMSTDTHTPAGVGNVACKSVLDFRHHDGSNQLGDVPGGTPGVPYSDYTGYQPVNTPTQINDPNRWQPLIVLNLAGVPAVQKYGNPYWYKVTKFNPDLPDFRLPGQDVFPSRGYARGVDRVLQYSAELTDEQKVIAEYWANGPRTELPPGHWQIFGQYVSRRDNHGVVDDVKMFFALGNAIFDASIVSWREKTRTDSVRPITAIHFLKAGQMVRAWAGPGLGTRLIRGEDWQPFQTADFVTPPFPEYISGHSTFSTAGAEVLRRFTGSSRFGACVNFPVGSSAVEPGLTPRRPVTLCWNTFKDAADEAGVSRRYGGIHFIPADLDGRETGRRIGSIDFKYAQKLINGGHDGDDRNDDDRNENVVGNRE